MRIVDADRLKRSFEANTPIAFQDCVPGIQAIIDLEPTVEAIPVEFIKSEIKENKGFYNSNLRRLLDVWAERKEK